MTSSRLRQFALLLLALAALGLGGCATVEVRSQDASEYVASRRGDMLTTGRPSAATVETIRVAGLEESACAAPGPACIAALAALPGISEERRLAALAELWLQQAMDAPNGSAPVAPWLETARHAYAYLFFSERSPGERAFEDRQTQVRDYYNYATQRAGIAVFDVLATRRRETGAPTPATLELEGWTVRIDFGAVRLPAGLDFPKALVPATTLAFEGLRSTYRREGFGAELVAVMGDDVMATMPSSPAQAEPPGWSEMPSPGMTLLFRFPGDDLAAILSTREVRVSAHDPYRDTDIELHGQQVPLAANFTAGYGLWLARSGFARQSLRTLLGREDGIDRPHLYLMQPFDPDRRIILMIHGLASSPEAWVNVANEVMGDATLRRHFQVWQVYYPTNAPIGLNHVAIRRILGEALRHFDPTGTAAASRDMVLIGHSMGGVIGRLMVSSSGDMLWDQLIEARDIDDGRLQRVERRLGPALRFEPVPAISRAIFIATPHRGTEVAGNRLGRWVSRLVRLPLTVLEGLGDVLEDLAGPGPASGRAPPRVPNSIDNLSQDDPFVRAAASLPISPRVRYHSIIAQRNAAIPLEASDDGLVPYRSAHLDGAVSEKVITSGHSVQETAPAILELRRILHEDLRDAGVMPRVR
ncbi:alpha/beta fold hydrolase [Luteimonas sp. MHLX1A]|uniref:alpha/beta fold hydrolase n=1 Tax=Alterluteimonas muca TaxID=2878684 RepID=UPI001E5924D6|nr:alpha/beta fold hydrolase [Luteimonas sp. MHLX1A]MCD9047312.1 alpha/beta fold hydrolase [Luteimonas sp. MHLX1A]